MKKVASPADWIVPTLVFLGHAALKMRGAWLAYQAKSTGLDGGYYLHVAMNVRDGLGLVTFNSPFHHGIPHFPFPSPIYPAWPILLGLVGRLWDIQLAAHFVPALFSLAAVVFAFLFGRALFPTLRRPLASFVPLTVHPGHFLALLFMIQPVYLDATVTPYTEGLAWMVMMAMLLRSLTIFERQDALSGLELGAWFGFLVLIRSQFFIVVLALVAWMVTRALLLPWLDRRKVRDSFLFAGAALFTFALCVLPTILRISTFALDPPFWSYLRFDQFQATRWLPQLQPMWPVSGMGGWIVDRLGGLKIAFARTGKNSYFTAFSAAAATIPLAIVVGAVAGVRERRRWKDALRALAEAPFLHFFIILALGSWLSLHAFHLRYWSPWAFAGRQGMAAVHLFFLCWVLLFGLRQWRWPGVVAVLILVATFVNRIHPQIQLANHVAKPAPWAAVVGEVLPEIVGYWPLVVMPGNGKLLSPWARGVGLHDLMEGDGRAEVVCLRDHLNARFAALSGKDLKNPAVRKIFGLTGSDRDMEHLGRALPEGWRLFEIPPGGEPCKGWDGREARKESSQGE